MKLTRVIFLALAFAIPFASTQLASAADEGAAAGETEKPAKKKGKKAKKAREEGRRRGREVAAPSSKQHGPSGFRLVAPALPEEPPGRAFRGLFLFRQDAA